jgi:hypothetical protein
VTFKTLKTKVKRFTQKSLQKDFGLTAAEAQELCMQAELSGEVSKWHNVLCSCGETAWSVVDKDFTKVDSGWCQECGRKCSKDNSVITMLYVVIN